MPAIWLSDGTSSSRPALKLRPEDRRVCTFFAGARVSPASATSHRSVRPNLRCRTRKAGRSKCRSLGPRAKLITAEASARVAIGLGKNRICPKYYLLPQRLLAPSSSQASALCTLPGRSRRENLVAVGSITELLRKQGRRCGGRYASWHSIGARVRSFSASCLSAS